MLFRKVVYLAIAAMSIPSRALGAQPVVTGSGITSASRASQSSPSPSPRAAEAAFTAAARERGLVASNWMTPARHTGDFDGDGKPDMAALVTHTRSKKRGILIIHGVDTAPAAGAGAVAGTHTRAVLVGAGVNFGNGGDDFEWANKWTVQKRKGKTDALLVEREESGGGVIEFVNGKYRWRQHGD
jgi:hypothetical protein